MINLIMGALFAGMGLFFIISFNSGSDFNLSVTLICGIFVVIGIIFFAKGLRKIIRDKRTSNNGEECFGILRSIGYTGTSVSGARELKGIFSVYVFSINQLIEVEEIIGFNPFKYNIGDYVKVKYFNGDINILEKTSVDKIPENVKNLLGYINTDIVDDIITIDGHKYKRID